MDFNFYLLATPGCNYTRNFERVTGLNHEKLSAFKPGQYQPSKEDFKPSFRQSKDKIFLKNFFYKKSEGNCLILCQHIYCLHA